jgi:hypothetical protein
MKVLSIGNSFSQDAHRWLHRLAEVNGLDVETVNLYIGGCSLETHWQNFVENNAFYDLEPNGGECVRKISIADALKMDKWDVVTLQQVSHQSGLPESYEPWLRCLAREVRKAQPEAKLYFHQTWAYDPDSDHVHFVNYDRDQDKMYNCIIDATTAAAKSIDAEIIPVGRVIQTLRTEAAEFDGGKGGLSLCRDGFHLSLNYGRYAAAATWLRTLTGAVIKTQPFEGFNLKLLERIAETVNSL